MNKWLGVTPVSHITHLYYSCVRACNNASTSWGVPVMMLAPIWGVPLIMLAPFWGVPAIMLGQMCGVLAIMLGPFWRVFVIVLGPIWGALVIMAVGVLVIMLGPKSITRWRNLGRKNHLQTKRVLARFWELKAWQHNYSETLSDSKKNYQCFLCSRLANWEWDWD